MRVPPLFDDYFTLGFTPSPEIALTITIIATRLRLFEQAIDEILLRAPHASDLDKAVEILSRHVKDIHETTIKLLQLLENPNVNGE
jgi:hypothetical protein